jgi:predicted cobalt transporter CbtA
VEEGVLSPALPCKLAAAVIHRMLWWKKGVLSCAVMHASCCHDPQNALVEEGVLSLRCHASSLLL